MIKVCGTLPLIYWSYLIINLTEKNTSASHHPRNKRQSRCVKITSDYIHLHTLNQGYNKFPSTLDFATCMGCSFPCPTSSNLIHFTWASPALRLAGWLHQVSTSWSQAPPRHTQRTLVCSTRLQGSQSQVKPPKRCCFKDSKWHLGSAAECVCGVLIYSFWWFLLMLLIAWPEWSILLGLGPLRASSWIVCFGMVWVSIIFLSPHCTTTQVKQQQL